MRTLLLAVALTLSLPATAYAAEPGQCRTQPSLEEPNAVCGMWTNAATYISGQPAPESAIKYTKIYISEAPITTANKDSAKMTLVEGPLQVWDGQLAWAVDPGTLVPGDTVTLHARAAHISTDLIEGPMSNEVTGQFLVVAEELTLDAPIMLELLVPPEVKPLTIRFVEPGSKE